MTHLTLVVIEDTLNEVTAVLHIVHFHDHEDVGVFRIRRDLRVNIIGDLTGTVDGVLVVTTKENILKHAFTGCSHQSLPTSCVTKACDFIGVCIWMWARSNCIIEAIACFMFLDQPLSFSGILMPWN